MMYYFIQKQRCLDNLYTCICGFDPGEGNMGELSTGFICVICCDNLYSSVPLVYSQQQTYFMFKWLLS